MSTGRLSAQLGILLMASPLGCRLHPPATTSPTPPQPVTATAQREEEQAIHRWMAEVESAWRGRDFERYLAHFSDDADLVNRVGRWFRGKAAIRQQLQWLEERGHSEMFKAESKLEKVRFVAPGVASLHQRRLDGTKLVSLATYLIARRPGPQGRFDRWVIQTLTIAPIE